MEKKVCILLYADDVILLAESEVDLKAMLNVLSVWCDNNGMLNNTSKNKILHLGLHLYHVQNITSIVNR